MDTQEQNTHFLDWLGEGSLPLMRGLQLAHKLQAELNGLPLSNLEEANKSSFNRSSLLAVLSDIVSSLNDGIHKLSSTPVQRSHENVCRKSPNSPRIAKGCKRSPRKIVKRCHTKFQSKLRVVKAEGLDDGFTWRKYGQKGIQGRSYPRSYYRCIHKGDLNCPALKQVQECDGIASGFDITYIEKHTCEGVCEGPYGTKGYGTPSSSLIGSENSHTSSLASMKVEPSLSISEIELEEEEQDSTISGFASSTRSLLYSLLEHEMLNNIPPMSPLQVSCNSLERTADNTSIKFHEEQQEESTHSDLLLPIWDCEPFPAFVDFEGQL